MFSFANIPPVVKNILIINGLLFLATSIAPTWGVDLGVLLGLHHPSSQLFYVHQIVTHIFMHGGFTHILFNMYGVFMFGSALEKVWGPKRFLIFYMVSGIGAAGFYLLTHHIQIYYMLPEASPEVLELVYGGEGAETIAKGLNYTAPFLGKLNGLVNGGMVGASGALFGLLLGYAMLFPNTMLMLLFIPFPIKAKYFVMGYGAMEIFLTISNNPNDNIAHLAHLGGMLFGFILIKLWQKDRSNFY